MKTITQQFSFSAKYQSLSSQTLDFALDNIGVYRSWRAFDPGKNYPVDDRFAAMPALTKKDIREHFPGEMLPANRNLNQAVARGEVQLVNSSGTTDDQITNIWNQEWWDDSERASWKLNSYLSACATGTHREAILVNPLNVGFASDKVDLTMEKRRCSRFLYLSEKTDPLSWTPALMDRMIEELNIFQPVVFEANPSYLARLCRYIAANDKEVFQPSAIVFTYEYPAKFHYRQIRRVFSVPLVSSYGTTETGYVFIQCENGRFHQNTDFCRVDFQPLKSEHGGPYLGRILVTPFNNPWSYILRFNTGDLVRLAESDKCECGRDNGIILSAIAGRKVNLTLTTSGRLITLAELDDAISVLGDLDMYQLVQKDRESYDLHLVCRETARSSLYVSALEIIKKLYGSDADVNVVFDDDIPPEPSGKYLIAKTLFPIDLAQYLVKSI